MFGLEKRKVVRLENRIESLEGNIIRLSEIRDNLTDANAELTSENKTLRLKKQMADEEIAHKLKMREEQVEMDANKRIADAENKAEKKAIAEIANTKDKYRDKLETQLEKRGNEMKEIQIEILNRLPDVSLAIKQKS